MALHALLLIFQYWLVMVLLWLQLGAAVLVPITGAKPGCPDKCGNISIPFPFGIGEGCFKSRDLLGWFESFNVTCNDTAFSPPKPFIGTSNIEILDISVRDSIIKVKLGVAKSCDNHDWFVSPHLGKFTISESRNKFIAIGCNTNGYITATGNDTYSTGCTTVCNNITDVTDGSCKGIGCCETSIGKGLTKYTATATSFYKRGSEFSFSPCSYAFVAEKSWFNFKISYIKDFNIYEVPVVLQWTVGNETCNEAKRNLTSYACRDNTYCFEPAGNVPAGYLCHCKPGYEGNPYLNGTTGGCQDIDECKNSPCKGFSANICINTEGGHECICPPNYRNRTGNDGSLYCLEVVKPGAVLGKVFIGIGIGILLFIVVTALSFWLYYRLEKRKQIIKKNNHFRRNGGLLLQQKVSSHGGSVDKAKIFASEELRKATDNFNRSRIIGKGGFGTVYKGMLSDGKIVAIKKSKVVDETQVDQFINEMVILSQINHRHIVKLLGCCLETEVPLLVYEFVSRGTLSSHIHGEAGHESNNISWNDRLRIASEVAGALAYLHSEASIPIFHRDIKSCNILLDENYRTKVSDFGISRSIPLDQTHVSTLVQGTFGYLDPEYFHSSQFTEKSDVYSFGVVLVELLTGETAISQIRSEKEKSLVLHFVSSMKANRLLEILETRVINEADKDEVLVVAKLAKRCLKLNGKKRPTMKEVVTVLDGLRRSSKDPWILDVEPNNNKEEKVHLLVDIELASYTETSTSGSVALAMESQVMEAPLINTGR